jgi:hypothetical protein
VERKMQLSALLQLFVKIMPVTVSKDIQGVAERISHTSGKYYLG